MGGDSLLMKALQPFVNLMLTRSAGARLDQRVAGRDEPAGSLAETFMGLSAATPSHDLGARLLHCLMSTLVRPESVDSAEAKTSRADLRAKP
jgi:hypothetical protein